MMTTKQQIMDIAMNLNRIGNWAADGYDAKQKRIAQFLQETKEYVEAAPRANPKFQKTFDVFQKEFKNLYKEGINGPNDEQAWAEQMMTWGNILTHRSSLL